MAVSHLTDIEQLMDQVKAYDPEADTGLIRRAYDYSAKAHDGQTRQTGEPYVQHPLAVAGILTFLKLDVPAIVAGLLHDTLEDTVATRAELEKEFGDVLRHFKSWVRLNHEKLKIKNSNGKQFTNYNQTKHSEERIGRNTVANIQQFIRNEQTVKDK